MWNVIKCPLTSSHGYCIVGLLLKDILYSELSSVTEKWYMIGVELGLNSSILDEIKRDYFRDNSRFKRMIIVWIKGEGKPVTWPTLIEALQAVDENGIAEELRDKYKTRGMFVVFFVLNDYWEYLHTTVLFHV